MASGDHLNVALCERSLFDDGAARCKVFLASTLYVATFFATH